MATRLRSSTGCWTCRLRRKKCDETKPACERCTKLKLTCDGYAERPFWMDGGVREKLRAEQVKQEVREKKSPPSSAKGSGSSSRSTAPKAAHARNTASVDLGTSLAAMTVTCQPVADLSASAIHGPDSMDFLNHLTYNDPDPYASWQIDTQSLLNFNQDQILSLDSQAAEGEVLQLLGSLSGGSSDELELQSFVSLSPGAEPDSRSQGPNSTSPPSVSLSSGSNSSSCSREHYAGHRNLDEASLLLHYLDNIQSLQLPFYWPGVTDRAWQYILITRARASYCATLSLSAYALGQDGSGYYELALVELRKLVPTTAAFAGKRGAGNALDCCFAMLQLIFLEMLQGQSEAYRMHMRVAHSLLAGLQVEKSRRASIESSSHQHPTATDPHSIDNAALHFITTSLRWCDTMVSCSLRLPPSFAASDTFDASFAEVGAHVGNHFGGSNSYQLWQNRVMSCISQISALDAWKLQVVETGQLSVVELVKRATAIETQLEECLHALGDESGPGASNGNVQHGRSPAAKRITDVFASAALVYLHVVVAGAQRRLPDVYNRVRAAVELLRSLPLGQMLLTCLSWPLCVIGCLAEGEDRTFANELLERASAEETGGLHRMGKNLALVKECWRLADNGDAVDPDWTTAMHTIGHDVILI